MTKIAVIGSLVVDMSMQTSRIPQKGENIHAKSFKMGAGGKGANAAAAIARLGGTASIFGCVGKDDLGRFEIESLQAEGVNTSGITIIPDRPTAVAFVMIDDDGENTILVMSEINYLLTGAMLEPALSSLWASLDAILVNFEISESAVRTAVNAGREHQVPVVVDAGPIRNYSPQSWQNATILSPNRAEASALLGYPVENQRDARRAARDLQAAGPKVVVLKLGGQGALLYTQTDEILVPAIPVRAVDTTGAGDAFTAGLTLALAEGRPLPEAVYFANAAGAVAVTRFGTMEAMPTRAEVEALSRR